MKPLVSSNKNSVNELQKSIINNGSDKETTKNALGLWHKVWGIIKRGNNAEIRGDKNGDFKVLSVKKTIV